MFRQNRLIIWGGALLLLGTGAFAQQTIDIDKYDMIMIYKNASELTLKMELDSTKSTYGGTAPYKILDKVTFTCESIGFSKSSEGYDAYDNDTESYKYYTKMLKNGVEATCEEYHYKKTADGKEAVVLIDGNN